MAALTPAEVRHDAEMIRQVPVLSGLSDSEIEALSQSSRHVTADPGDVLIREGDAGESLFIVLSGELEVTKREGGFDVLLASRKPGEFFGEMSLLEQLPRSASVRAVRPSQLLEIGGAGFQKLLETSPPAARTILRTVASRLRSTEASLVQSDKLVALGTLAAGLAHELNNPAAAIQRSASTLLDTFAAWRTRAMALGQLALSADERAEVAALEGALSSPVAPVADDAALRKIEGKLTDRLDDFGVGESWEVGPALAAHGWTVEKLDALAGKLAPEHLDPVVQWLSAGLTAAQLIDEIQMSAAAISALVGSVKSYAYMDQAPLQDVDVVKSIGDTLMILGHKLKRGIQVQKAFEPDLPRIEAYGGELNQVWTNLIDNSIHAMDGHGTLEVGARRVGDCVEVVIADSGPGIPPEVAPHIFEPFYTTKAQGVGTGLGLHIAHTVIVNHHGGRLDFDTRPGRTEFRIMLPQRLKSPPPGAPKRA